MTLTYSPSDCTGLGSSGTREWLVTDGLGGFAMGTISGLRTRRYHGLLIAATQPPIGRIMTLASLDAFVIIKGVRVGLATHEWESGVIEPKGYLHLVSFTMSHGVPCWRWQIGDVIVERELAMAYGRNAVGVVHRVIRGPGPIHLQLEALVTNRDVHGERYASGTPLVEHRADGFTFEETIHMRADGWNPAGDWYRGVHHREEAARGLTASEDLWLAGRVDVTLDAGSQHEVIAWTGDISSPPKEAFELIDDSRARFTEVGTKAGSNHHAFSMLAHAADQFIVTGSGGPTVVAGYPWFGDWSRDTMTSYEGLFLATGRIAEGRVVLQNAAASLSEGMLANTADVGGTEYNTVDAALWFLHAVDRHRTYESANRAGSTTGQGDDDLGGELLDDLVSVIGHYRSGTRFGIHVDPVDGLVAQGADGWALTWMDARIGTQAITPRIGKPVEINALWINGIAAVLDIMTASDDRRPDLEALHTVASASFLARFVRTDTPGLYDVIDAPGGHNVRDGNDASIRPNQLVAVSLPHGPLADDAHAAVARSVVEACAALLTPFGPRSLEPGDANYLGQHRGDTWARDHAYHQGTVWPWLIGPYVDACRRLGISTDELLGALMNHLRDFGIGSVSETMDGNAPHQGTGCPFQAWSVAELLRISRLP